MSIISNAARVVQDRSEVISAEVFRKAMRRFAGVCTIVTSADIERGPEGWVGLTATAVSSVTTEPPRILVCINRTALAHQTIVRSGVLGINVLAAENDGLSLARRFGGGQCSAEERFSEGNWAPGILGAPLLSESLVSFECKVESMISSGTHDVIIGDVADIAIRPDWREPLIYFDGTFKLPTKPN
jgi:flavin reductase (DIM6/NTAB) family NADH-FMN oxidoreductase RutF